MKVHLFLIGMLMSASLAFGATLNEAKEVFLSGDYEKALPMLEEQYRKNKRNASVNQWIGVCLYNLGRMDEAKPYFEFAKSKRVTESYKYLALIDFYDYDFDGAEEMLSLYAKEMTKLKKEMPAEINSISSSISKAKVMLDHVEKITIIDSIVVDKSDFFKHYRLSSSTGTLNGAEVLPFKVEEDSLMVVYMPESGASMIWSQPDTAGVRHLYESGELYGGRWDGSHRLSETVNMDGSSAYPFMMADGLTLYYANNGKESIGGYDIFISRKDSETGEFYQPQNIGMPFNSPFDDYMLVIDEFTGAGWWATDRNRIPGKVTIYVYIPNQVRENYSPDDPNLMSYALIRNISDTWTDEDFAGLLAEINSLSVSEKKERKDFEFHLTNGVVYTRFDQFKTSEARHRMEELIVMIQNQRSDMERLNRLREQYSKVTEVQRGALRGEILRLEDKVDQFPADRERVENEIRKLELRNL